MRLASGGVLLAGSAYLYLLYQQTEALQSGAAAIVAFGLGSYCALSEVGALQPLRRLLPFIVVGASGSLALATLGFSSVVARSSYAATMSFSSARLVALLFGAAGTRVSISGSVLAFPNGVALSIGPLCSGAYSSALFMLLSLVMVADLGRKAPRRRVAVALCVGLAGANLANVFRIAFLATVMYAFGLGALDVVHQFAGYAVFLAFMAGFWVLALRWVGVRRPVVPD